MIIGNAPSRRSTGVEVMVAITSEVKQTFQSRA
jgi:hypothetical protein